MNNKRMWLWMLLPFICMQANAAFSQRNIVTEEVFSLGMQLGVGTRAIGMGGAFTSIGGDYSASFWNPATLRNIDRIEVYGSLSHLGRENAFDLSTGLGNFSPSGRKSEDNFTKFNDIGLAYPVPTMRGALVFAFGFNRVKSYDSNLDFKAFNGTPDDEVEQSWRELERGGLNVWTMSGAVDVSPNVSLGLGLNFWSGGSDFESTFIEFDRDDLYTFDTFTVENGLETDITGFNAKFGALFRMGELLNLGLTIATPITFKVEENWSNFEETVFDDAAFADTSDSGVFEYKIRSPWTFTGGASIHLLNLVVSGDIEYNDWTQIAYKSEPPFDGVTENQGNRNIRDNYRATARIRLGAELNLPPTGMSFRAGYFRDPSVFENADADEDKQFLSAGLGFQVDKQAKLDVAFVRGFWKSFNSGLSQTEDVSSYVEDITVNQVFVSLALRL